MTLTEAYLRLGLTHGAPAATVRAAFRAQSRAKHPDHGGDEHEPLFLPTSTSRPIIRFQQPVGLPTQEERRIQELERNQRDMQRYIDCIQLNGPNAWCPPL